MSNQFTFTYNAIIFLSLVITVIVLLILAGVAIATLTGENGIYSIVVFDKNEGYKTARVEVKNLTEDMEIWNKADMENFRNKVNEGRTVKVMANINLNPGKYTEAEDGTVTYGEDAEEWIPI